jgi:hypothetical protein
MIRLSENIVELHYDFPDKEEEQTSILFFDNKEMNP